MMTSSRPRDVGGSFASRRGHASQLSISDPSHHVTEAIGTLYGSDDEDSGPESRPEHRRPLSFIASPYGGEQISKPPGEDADQADDPRRPLMRSASDNLTLTVPTVTVTHGGANRGVRKSQTVPGRMPSQRSSPYDDAQLPPMSPLSPTLSLRDVQAADSAEFSLTESPNDIAQELSNLQALRRMSMDVGNNSDPDLMPFQSPVAMPLTAPRGDDDENDPSRLLWVPAGVHPELAPEQFKNFLERRVKSMKRRSGDSMLSVDSLQPSESGSLRRKKSMLSKQIDNSGGHGADGYVDGAERLGRHSSLGGHPSQDLTLDELVKDPTKIAQKLAQESRQDAVLEAGAQDDMPILPVAPGMGLRRSTRTTYRKGGSLRGDRVPFAKRLAARQAGKETEDAAPPLPKIEAPPGHGLSRVQSEPISENFSRPGRSVRRQQNFTREAPAAVSLEDPPPQESRDTSSSLGAGTHEQSLPIRTSAEATGTAAPVPQIVDVPPGGEPVRPQAGQQASRPYPQRTSSQKAAAQAASQQPSEPHPTIAEPPPRSSKRPPLNRSLQTSAPASQANTDAASSRSQTLNDIANHPTPVPGSGALRTDSLTFIPTMASEEKKADKKSRDSDVESTKSTSSGWKWFKSDDKDKKKKDKDKDEAYKKSKAKSGDKAHENARLDVIQSSIDSTMPRGRESLLLDRDSVDNRLQEERKKESSRKSSDGKKEKDGFFGSFFSGGKKKGDRDSGGSKKHQREPSPSPPPPRQLQPDIDYPYTRFPILEERAIYRMAHIKLANPKRSLLSQVLLSNFMYSYLAKIQAMNPQIQVPISPQQKRQEEERKRKEQEQQQQQQGGQDSIDSYNFEYHRATAQYAETGDGAVPYVDDSEIYDYEHDNGSSSQQQQQQQDLGYHSNDGYGGGQRDYYDYDHHDGGQSRGQRSREEDEEMW